MALREASDWYWISKDPTDVVARSRGLTGALGVLSFNRNGYVREAAIRALSDVHSGHELPFLLIRLNDWVHPIRDAARRAILSRVEPKYAAQFVFNLSLIWRLRAQHRADHQPIAEAILNLLMHRECREPLLAGLELSERETRRAVFRLLLDAREPEPHWLYKALDGRDTVLKAVGRTRIEVADGRRASP